MIARTTETELAARSSTTATWMGLFAATPQLEALRLLLSGAATSDVAQTGDVAGGRKDNKIPVADVSRAFFEAPAKRDICVKLPGKTLGRGRQAKIP